MSNITRLDPVSVVGIWMADDGRSLQLELVNTIPPYNTVSLKFLNSFAISLFQSHNDGYPLVLCELTWCALLPAEKRKALEKFGYPIFDAHGDPTVLNAPLVVAHLEGDLVGDILAEAVTINSNVQ